MERHQYAGHLQPTLPPPHRHPELWDGSGRDRDVDVEIAYDDFDPVDPVDPGTGEALACMFDGCTDHSSRIVRIYPGRIVYEVPEDVKTAGEMRDWLKSMGCEWLRSGDRWRKLPEKPLTKQLPPTFTFQARQQLPPKLSDLDLQQAVRRALEQDSSARVGVRFSAMASSTVESCPELLLWDEQIVRRQVPREAVSVDDLLPPLRPLVAELRYLHFLLFESREASLEKLLQMRSSRAANQDDKEVVYHPLFLQFCRGAASGQPDIKFDEEDHRGGAREDIRVLAAGTSQASELKATFHCAEQGDVTGGIDRNKLPLAKLLKCNMKDPQPWHLGIFAERIERVWFALFTYGGQDGQVQSLTVAPPFPVSNPRDLTQLCDRKNLLFEVSTLDMLKKRDAVLQDVVPRSPEPGFKLLVRYVDSLCSRLNVPPAPIDLVRHDGRKVTIDGARIIGTGGKSVVLRRSEEENAVYKVSDKARIEREVVIHAYVDGLPCIRPMRAPELYGEVTGAGRGLSWLALAGYGREMQRGDLQNRFEDFWSDGERAVHSIHQRGILHRDIKPANFLIFGRRLQLNDFDASCFAGESLDVLGQRVGTPYFESPFFDMEKGYQYRDDWCSLVFSFLYVGNFYKGTGGMAVLQKALAWRNLPDGMRACIQWINSQDAAEGRKRSLLSRRERQFPRLMLI